MAPSFELRLTRILAISNLLWISAYLVPEKSYPPSLTSEKLSLVFFACLAGGLALLAVILLDVAKVRKNAQAVFLNLNLTVFFVGLSVILLELAFAIAPWMFPASIRNLVFSGRSNPKRPGSSSTCRSTRLPDCAPT